MRIDASGIAGLDDAVAVMAQAFDPRFGEAWTGAQVRGVLAMPGADLLIARETRPCGFALLRTVVGEAELMLLATVPSRRCEGLGRALVEAAAGAARSRDGHRLFLEVRDDNPAVAFYQRVGFQPVGRRRNYYKGKDGKLRDALTFALSLR